MVGNIAVVMFCVRAFQQRKFIHADDEESGTIPRVVRSAFIECRSAEIMPTFTFMPHADDGGKVLVFLHMILTKGNGSKVERVKELDLHSTEVPF